MKISQDRVSRLEALDPGQRLRYAKMARMGLVAQCVQNPNVEPAERLNAVRRQSAKVAGISKAIEPKTQRWDVTVLLQNRQCGNRASLPLNGQRLACLEPILASDRRVFAAWRRSEAIAEARVHDLRRAPVQIDWHALAAIDEEATQVVDAMGMVGVLVRVEYGVEPIHH